MNSYAAYFTTTNPPSPENMTTNALRFPTEEEATDYMMELLSRWYAPTGSEVRPHKDQPTHRWDNGLKPFDNLGL